MSNQNKFSKIEEDVLKFWDEENIFEKSIKHRENAPIFSFYDGPPFATGKPHYGHVLATTIKDAVLRYKTMCGYKVPRKVGWDCHGLPVENLIEKELGIKNKKEIEEMGVLKFNEACRGSVFRCVDDFKETLKRVGRWADYSNDYSTMDNDYIESVWWVFKQLYDKGLVYREYRVSPYCPRCGTPLSNFEVNQGYSDTVDPSIYVKLKINKGEFSGAFLLAWTTTPWTLPGNVALAINKDLQYAIVSFKEEKIILLKEKVEEVFGEDAQIISTIKGSQLVGLSYEPMFPYIKDKAPKGIENAFKVYPAEFVSNEDGTGVVHTAVMYGEDDFQLGKKYDLPFFHTVNEAGEFSVGDLKGKNIKEAKKDILDYLSSKGLLLKEETIKHSYPFCWRCDTPLIYYALQTFYISVTEIKDKMISSNEKIYWIPDHVKKGRFGKWLEGARDWSFSRNRFWGSPIPLWECEKCGKMKAVGSKEELGKDLDDLHRPFIDEVVLDCSCGGKMHRVEEVFDCWFESGSMPYGQWHYPFENKELVEKTFPADFIAEGMDQTRGWFYTLHVLATALTKNDSGLGENLPAFKNVIVNGLVLDEKGNKLSKKLKNYPDMSEIFDSYGADSLRFFLLSSTPIGEDYRFSGDRVRECYTKVISTFYHCFSFFTSYGEFYESEIKDPLNLWVLSRLQQTGQVVKKEMNRYDLTSASREIASFIYDLSNWYVRRSRKQFKDGNKEFFATLYKVLVDLSKMLAPFSPFISEHIYKELTGDISVHLADFPNYEEVVDEKIIKQMKIVREAVSESLKQRADAGIKVRQPLSLLEVEKEVPEELFYLIKEEVNVKKVVYGENIKLHTQITEELKKEGEAREVIRFIQTLRKEAGLTPNDRINIFYKGEQLPMTDMIVKETLSDNISEYNNEELIAQKTIKLGDKEIFIGIQK